MKRISLLIGSIIICMSANCQEIFVPNQQLGNSSNNNIGIGTNTPQSKIEIRDYSPSIRLRDLNSGNTSRATIQFGTSYNNDWIRTAYIGDGFGASNDFGISVENKANFGINVGSGHPITQPDFFIDTIGNVGICKNNPQYKLDVNGDIASSGVLRLKAEQAKICFYGDASNESALTWALTCHPGTANNDLILYNHNPENASTRLLVDYESGSVSIGTGVVRPDAALTVGGKLYAEEIEVVQDVASIPDYVFEKDYNLISLEQVEDFIKSNKHLPGVPSASEYAEKGLNIGEMNCLLLKKIEELTLYIIDQEKRIIELENN